jgi:hypothetical protein
MDTYFDTLVNAIIKESMNGSNWGNTSWTDTIDGKEITITLKDLLTVTKDIPIQNIPTKDLESYALHKDKKDKETLANVERADLTHAIIVLVIGEGKRTSILDGHHRLQKCINNDIPTIKARVIHLKDLPEEYQKVLG